MAGPVYTQRSLYPVTESSASARIKPPPRVARFVEWHSDAVPRAWALSFLSRACGPRRALSSGPFSLFEPGRISVRMRWRKEDLPRRSGTGSATAAAADAASSFRDYEVDFRRSVWRLYKTHFVLEEGIIDWNRSPHRWPPPPQSHFSICTCYSRKDPVVVDPFFEGSGGLTFFFGENCGNTYNSLVVSCMKYSFL